MKTIMADLKYNKYVNHDTTLKNIYYRKKNLFSRTFSIVILIIGLLQVGVYLKWLYLKCYVYCKWCVFQVIGTSSNEVMCI